MKRDLRFKNDERGITLVEMIVSILIMSVISAMIVMFISTSRTAYDVVSTDAMLQSNVEIVRKYIGELAVEASSWGKRSYTYSETVEGGGSVDHTVDLIWFKALDNDQEGLKRDYYDTYTDAEGNERHRFYYYYVFLLRPDGKLAYGKYPYSASLMGTGSLFGEGFTLPNEDYYENNILSDPYSILAEHVTSIDCTNSATPGKTELMKVKMALEYNGHQYDATINFSGRNKTSDSE